MRHTRGPRSTEQSPLEQSFLEQSTRRGEARYAFEPVLASTRHTLILRRARPREEVAMVKEYLTA